MFALLLEKKKIVFGKFSNNLTVPEFLPRQTNAVNTSALCILLQHCAF